MPEPHDEQGPVVRQRGEPLVLTLDEALTRSLVDKLRRRIRGVPAQRPVILDLTTICGFDSDGTAQLQALQDDLGPERLVVVGLRQAAARLFGLASMLAGGTEDDDEGAASHIRPTPGMVFVELKPRSSALALNSELRSAIAKDIAIVIVDLAAIATASIDVLDALSSASRAAALHGQELVLVNVEPEMAQLLDRLRLDATMYLTATP